MPRPPTFRRARGLVMAIVTIALLAFPLGVLASHQFSDVPDSHLFHNDVDALVDSGVTSGCGGGKYCPEAFVTRGQMAAFLNRLGALQAGKTPVVNAAELNGLTSSAFHRYTANAPFGTTQYGLTGVAGHAAAGGQFDAGYASYPVPLASAPTAHVITPGDPVPSGCSGSASSPAADAGHLCIWVTYELNTSGSYTVFSQAGAAGASRHGFVMDLASAAGGNFAVNAVYAVNAPLSIIFPLDDPADPEPATLGTD